MLKERHEIESNYNHLHAKFNQIQVDENERKEKVKFFNLLPCAPKILCLVPFSTKKNKNRAWKIFFGINVFDPDMQFNIFWITSNFLFC